MGKGDTLFALQKIAKKLKILNFGSLNIDNTYRVRSIVKPGETIASSGIDLNCGGKRLNQSVALARAGMEVMHAGLVGNDGQILVEMLKSAGVNTDKIEKTSGKSGHTIIQVDDGGQNSIILYGGANRQITKEYIDQVLENVHPGEKEAEAILKAMKEKYSKAGVILMLGTKGAYFQKEEVRCFQEACKVDAVDTTGAGDTFTGFFIKEYFESGDAKGALSLAAKASAIAVTRPGAAQAIPKLSEVIGKREKYEILCSVTVDITTKDR